ncbi:FIST signal transduction protein [Cryptosporangium minutisporangium]|uniref:FIST N-terminal domain-containing protein n=1 Tax=Cryptosporangium minutisporangium TaxID=113569 RepID=A0ABP6SXM8_9ACTN
MAASWVNVGCSANVDSYVAGAEAARAALSADDPQLLVVFFAITHDPEQVLAGVRSVGGAVPLIGCPTSGEIAGDWAGDGSVVVTAIGGPGVTVRTAGVDAAGSASEALRDAGARAVAPLADLTGGEHRFVLLLTDGQGGNQQDMLRGAYGALGAGVPLVGGCGATTNIGSTITAPLLHDDRMLWGRAVVAASIASDNPFGIGVRHGWERTGEAVEVTSSIRNRVLELDNRPALDVYLERLGAPAACWTDQASFQRFSLLHPLGIRRPSGDEMRVVAWPDYDQRSISSAADVPEDCVAWLMRGDPDSLLAAADQACADAIAGLSGRPLAGLLAFDCIGRRQAFAADGVTDVARLAAHAGGAPLAGFYSHGEIARTRGVTGFHNQALVVLALS